MSNCKLKHNHTVIPPEVKGFHKIQEWKRKMTETHYQVKCNGCNKYLIWVKRHEN